MRRKLCLLAALLRANKIPSVISYQLLTRADDVNESYIIHALNILYIKDLNKGVWLDARGNKENINDYSFYILHYVIFIFMHVNE